MNIEVVVTEKDSMKKKGDLLEKIAGHLLSNQNHEILEREVNKISASSLRVYKPNYEDIHRKSSMLGDRGEQLVMNKEKEFLNSKKHLDLANKVKRVSLKSDSLGYDIMSFGENGEAKYIEVKATKNSISQFDFYLTNREKETAEEYGELYYLYVVFCADTLTPKIARIKNPMALSEKLRLVPDRFRATLNVKEKDIN